MKKTLILFTILLFLSACSTGKDVSLTDVEKVKIGSTTEQQVIDMFGEPTTSSLNFKAKRKTYTYDYANADFLKKALATTGGAVAGSIIGNKLGSYGGQLLGGSAGAFLGGNAVKERSEKKSLIITFNTKTGKVSDVDFIHNQRGSQKVKKGKKIGSVG